MVIEKPNALFIKDKKELIELKKEIVSIEYIDAIDNEVDGVTIVFAQMYDPPLFGDQIDVSIGFGDELNYIGQWYVSGNAEYPKEGIFEVRLTSVSFSKSLKERRTMVYKNITLNNLLLTIANRHGLKLKNDDTTSKYIIKSQTNESDLAFMKRIADENNATFAIKNDTIIFKFKLGDEDKNLPVIKLDLTQVDNLKINRLDKTIYRCGMAIWHDTRTNKACSICIGSGEPVLRLEGSYKTDAEALHKLHAALARENAGTVRGHFETTEDIIAGIGLELDLGGRLEKDLQITEVKHEINSHGYIKTVHFTK